MPIAKCLEFLPLNVFLCSELFIYNMTFDWLQYIPLITFSTIGQLEDIKSFPFSIML